MASGHVLELYGVSADHRAGDWSRVVREERCRYLNRTCLKARKSTPDITIGTCLVRYGRLARDVVICPHRFLERRQIFMDCLHLLSHEPGDELHIVSEFTIPGGSVDYLLVLADARREIKDFVGIELQALDTTGTVWPARHAFLEARGVGGGVPPDEKPFGMNWKMTAKTILVQLNHKIGTFEALGRKLVLVLQDHLMRYMMRNFDFDHVASASPSHSMRFHVYEMHELADGEHKLHMVDRRSTTAGGVKACLALASDAVVQLDSMHKLIAKRLGDDTLFHV